MTNDSKSFDADEVSVEEFGRSGNQQRLPRARVYVIRVDKTTIKVPTDEISGREILTLAGKMPPDQYKLTQKLHGGGAKTIGLDDVVDLREPGVERFMTLKLDQTEG